VSDAVLDSGLRERASIPHARGPGLRHSRHRGFGARHSGAPARDSGVSDILRSTPWATVIEGSEAGLLPGLRKAIDATLAGTQSQAPLPELPTEDQWAQRVSKLCGWA